MAFIPIHVDELRVGLFIKLECSWWNHPFAKSKFKISSSKEIKIIKGIRKAKLYYDPDLSDPEEEQTSETNQADRKTDAVARTIEEREREQEEIRKDQIRACEEHTAELQKSSYLYQQVFAQTKIALKRIGDGHAAGIKSAEQVISSLLHSLNKPESSMALIDILTSMETDDPFVAHALNVSIVSLLVGKDYQLEEDELHALGLTGLLHDIGKLNSSSMVRMKRSGMTKNELEEFSKHPGWGKEAVARFPAIPESAGLAIFQHHERLDGSGFPLGLKADEISFFAKIVMVADEYDHLCHQSHAAKSLTPSEALSHLYDHFVVDNLNAVGDTINDMLIGNQETPESDTNVSGDDETRPAPIQDRAELSEEIIAYMVRALGVYPPGSLVELSNGSVGLVTGANSEERTKPCVMICSPHTPRKEAPVIDLNKEKDLSIVHSVRPQHLPKEIHDYVYAGRST